MAIFEAFERVMAKVPHTTPIPGASPDAGVFAALADPAVFAQVTVEHGAVTWPGEIDLAPDSMHAAIAATGEWMPSLRN